jgi:hypothetical protein
LYFLNENKIMQVHVNIFTVEHILNQPVLLIVLGVWKWEGNVGRMVEVELGHLDCWKMEEEGWCCSSQKEANKCEGIIYK